MSVKIMSKIFEIECLKPTERLILLALADHANDEGECYPSIARLCLRTGLGERAIQNNLRNLKATGFLEIEAGGGRNNCNLYRVKIPHFVTETPHHMHPAPDAPPPETPHMVPETPHMVTKNPAPDAPEPSITIIEPSVIGSASPPQAKKRRRPEVDLPDGWVPNDTNVQHALSKNFTQEQIRHEADQFANYHRSKQSRFRDWDAAWRTWIGNAEKFGRGGNVADQARSGGYGQGGSIPSIVARRRAAGEV